MLVGLNFNKSCFVYLIPNIEITIAPCFIINYYYYCYCRCVVIVIVVEGVYVNLLDNPERFTGYAGESARRVWRAIYEENCFNMVSNMDSSNRKISHNPVNNRHQLASFSKMKVETEDSDTCFEKRVYYRLISGECFIILCLGNNFLVFFFLFLFPLTNYFFPFFSRFLYSSRSTFINIHPYMWRIFKSNYWTMGEWLIFVCCKQ